MALILVNLYIAAGLNYTLQYCAADCFVREYLIGILFCSIRMYIIAKIKCVLLGLRYTHKYLRTLSHVILYIKVCNTV